MRGLTRGRRVWCRYAKLLATAEVRAVLSVTEAAVTARCLRQLAATLERSHARGGALPYNPTALVRRLAGAAHTLQPP
jgi:hypothetical protein